MALGDTMKLGYLECSPFGERTTKPEELTRVPVLENIEAFGGTLKLNDVRMDSRRSSSRSSRKLKDVEVEKADQSREPKKDEAPVQPLEWTHPPLREVQSDGRMRYQVSKAADPSKRDHKHHLVRTTRLEPRPSSSNSSRSLSVPSARRTGYPVKGSEEIVVTEADFRRCGKRLTLLRQCKLEKLPAKMEETRKELELSFKSAFRLKCQSQEEDMIEPWKDCEHPEACRPSYEGDLVLNQVWLDHPSPKIAEVEDTDDITPLPSSRSNAPERASSADATMASRKRSSSRDRRLEKHRTCPEPRKSVQRPTCSSRARSQGCIFEEDMPASPPWGMDRDQNRSRRAGHASGCPKPGSAGDSPAKKEYVDRIQVVDETEGDDERKYIGSLAVQEGARRNQRFHKELSADCELNKKEQALWISLDPLTGEVNVFPRAAATRLEAAYVNNRTRVPLAGLQAGMRSSQQQKEFEDDIVHLGTKGGSDHPVQKSLQGEQRDVRRLMVKLSASEVCINVVYDHGWRIADDASEGSTETRVVVLYGTETVRPPTPPLPPVNPDRRASYGSCLKPWWE